MGYLQILEMKTPEEINQWLIENAKLILKKTEIDTALVLVFDRDPGENSFPFYEIMVLGGPLNFHASYTEDFAAAISCHGEFIEEIETYTQYETIININPDWKTSLPVFSNEFKDFAKTMFSKEFSFTRSDMIMFESKKDAAIFTLSHYYNEQMEVVK